MLRFIAKAARNTRVSAIVKSTHAPKACANYTTKTDELIAPLPKVRSLEGNLIALSETARLGSPRASPRGRKPHAGRHRVLELRWDACIRDLPSPSLDFCPVRVHSHRLALENESISSPARTSWRCLMGYSVLYLACSTQTHPTSSRGLLSLTLLPHPDQDESVHGVEQRYGRRASDRPHGLCVW